ncbi:MAG: tyrosine-type recombinase/integrase [Clostridiales bacterium]|nr:tyrosine-type recombinase/integrase [Clostridiales bacterium]
MAACKKCHKQVEPDWTYCPHCGASLKAGKPKGTKSRANGTGTAYKRGKTWTARIVIGYRTVKQTDGSYKVLPDARTKGGFPTKTEALAYCLQIKGKPKLSRINDNATFASIYDRWDAEHSLRIAKSTMACYRAAYKYFSDIQYEKITDLTYSELQSCIDKCPKGRSTKDDMRVVCSHLFKYAIKNGLDVKNQASNLFCGKEKKGTREPFTASELKQIGDAVGKIPYADYIYCMCYLGFRPNEMFELTKASYDHEHQCFIGGFKTEAGTNRIITVSPKIQPIILKQLANDSNFIFPRADGTQMTDEYFRKYCFYPIMKELGIENRKPYSCRHTFANLLKGVSGSDTDKAALIGHADASMTKYYQSPDYASMKAITDAI